eukprot:10333921-Prorocentrum_lima.AAC.1
MEAFLPKPMREDIATFRKFFQPRQVPSCEDISFWAHRLAYTLGLGKLPIVNGPLVARNLAINLGLPAE